jgi:hypothetical protein
MRALPALFLALLLAGCATQYQPASSLTGGYSDHQISPGVWQVSYVGGPSTNHESAQTYWLYRSASLALEQGYDGFEVLTPTTLSRHAGGAIRLALEGVIVGPTVIAPMSDVELPSGTAAGQLQGDIRLVKRPLAGEPPRVFDAAALKASLDPLVKGPKCDGGNVCPNAHDYLRPPRAQAAR